MVLYAYKKKGRYSMKYLIASDIHGSAYYCQRLVDSYKTENADKIILLGDLLYHGPRNDLPKDYNPKLVIDMLNSLRDDILCVRGNCDAEIDQMVLSFPIMADYAVLPYGARNIYMTHGHIYNEDRLPPIKKGDILLNGHTHIAKYTLHDDYVYINPGSCSIPKENTHHGNMTLEDNILQWKNFENEIIMTLDI